MSDSLPGRTAQLLLESNQRVVDSLEDRLFESEGKLEQSEEAKTSLGVTCYHLQNEVNRLKANVEKAEQRARLAEKHNSDLQGEKNTAKNLADEMRTKCIALEKVLDATKVELAKEREHVELIKRTSKSLKVGLQTQKMNESAVVKEVNLLESKLKAASEENEALMKKLKQANAENLGLKKTLEMQEHETKLAQRHLERVVEEVQVQSASRNVMQKQWQSALVAMSKRDQVLANVEKRKQELETRLENEVLAEGGKVQSVKKLAKELEQQRLAALKAEDAQNKAQEELMLKNKTIQEMSKLLERERQEREKALQEVETLKERSSQALAEMEKQKTKQRELHGQMNHLEEEKSRLSRELETIEQKYHQERAVAAHHGSKLESVVEVNKHIDLENKFNRQVYEAQQRTDEIAKLEKQVKDIKEQLAESEKERGKLQESVFNMEMKVLRQRAALDRMNETLEAQRLSNKRPIGQGKEVEDAEESEQRIESDKIKALREKLSASEKVVKLQHKEIDMLRMHWSKAEGKLIMTTDRLAASKPREVALNQEIKVFRHMQQRAKSEIATLQKDRGQEAVQGDLARLAQKKLHARNFRLEQDREVLESKLGAAELQAKMVKHNAQSELDILRSSLVEARKAAREALQNKHETDSQRVVQNGRYELLLNKYQDTKAKLEAAELEVGALKSRLVDMTRENSEMKKTVLQMTRDREREFLQRGQANTKNVQRKQSHRLTRSVNSPEVDQLQLQLKQAQAKLASKEEETTQLRHKLEQVSEQAKRLGQAFLERDTQSKELDQKLTVTKEAFERMTARCEKATQVACALEKQLIDRKQAHEFINYNKQGDARPTQALLSAIGATLGEGHRDTRVDHQTKESVLRTPSRPSSSNSKGRTSFSRSGGVEHESVK